MRRYSNLVADLSGVMVENAAKLHSINVTNTHNAVLYFMLFDNDTAPAADEDPVLVVQLPASGSAGATTVISGEAAFGRFRTGIAWGTSTTADDYTAYSSAKLAVHAVYT